MCINRRSDATTMAKTAKTAIADPRPDARGTAIERAPKQAAATLAALYGSGRLKNPNRRTVINPQGVKATAETAGVAASAAPTKALRELLIAQMVGGS